MNADPFGEGIAPRLLSNISCSGSESSLLDCTKTGFNGVTCPTAGVVCQGKMFLIRQFKMVSKVFVVLKTIGVVGICLCR